MPHGKKTRRPHVLAALLLAVAAFLGAGTAAAGETAITVGEITPSAGVEAADVRAAAEVEIARLDATQLQGRGKLVVALALVKTTVDNAVKYTVNAMIRDAKTGTMIAIIEGGAHAQGELSLALAKQVAGAAIRSAISRIPLALLAKK